MLVLDEYINAFIVRLFYKNINLYCKLSVYILRSSTSKAQAVINYISVSTILHDLRQTKFNYPSLPTTIRKGKSIA